jgi:hypothetical protein
MALALVLVALLGAKAPPFAATISPVTAEQLGRSYRPGCPVAPAQLRLVRVAYWGFDDRRRVGSLVVSAAVASEVVTVFRRLYRERFPIRRIEPIDVYGGSDDASMAADNTSAFNCRYAVAPGPRHWSAHAYGEAIDVNPVENPYLEGGKVLPPAGARYADRSRPGRGTAVSGGTLVEAFRTVGWSWGGRWAGSPDYQHFSATGG